MFSPAPRKVSAGVIPTPSPTEKASDSVTANQKLKALTLRASACCAAPSSREISVPPPMPASDDRQSSMLKTGRISDAPASI